MIKKGYHTQENRGSNKLKKPIKCTREDAWFGDAWYYWESKEDADFWGNVSKKQTGHYDVYCSKLDCDNFLDTVFNERHYRVWLQTLEKLILKFKLELGKDVSLKEINDYFKQKGLYKKVDGVIFQDISNRDSHYLIKGFQLLLSDKTQK